MGDSEVNSSGNVSYVTSFSGVKLKKESRRERNSEEGKERSRWVVKASYLGGDEVSADRVADEFRGAMYMQFLHDAAAVRFDGLGA
jgi:hypothetical protein